MSNHQSHTNGGDAEPASAYNVIVASFDPDTNAYAAMTTLKELDAQQRLDLQAAAVVVRDDEGRIAVKDQTGTDQYVGAAGGGLIGVLLGIIGGPLGVLLGGTYGVMVGSLIDLGEMGDSESVLSRISMSVKPGRTALLAEVAENSSEVVDSAIAQLGGTVFRRPVFEVEAEIAAAESAQLEAQRQADKELLAAKRDSTKKEAHAKVEQLKAKLPRRNKATSVGS